MEGTLCPEAQLRGRRAAEVFLLLGVSSCDVSPSCHLLTPPQAVWRAVEICFSLFPGSITGPSQSEPPVTSGMAVAAMEEAGGAGRPLLRLASFHLHWLGVMSPVALKTQHPHFPLSLLFFPE